MLGRRTSTGITAREVLDAPTFAEVAPQVISSLVGKTMVAHNARFDTSFLDYEFARAGIATTPPTPSLCTMQWSARFLRGACALPVPHGVSSCGQASGRHQVGPARRRPG